MFSEPMEQLNIVIVPPVNVHACQMLLEFVAMNVPKITGKLLAARVVKPVTAMKLELEVNSAIL